MQEVKEMFAMLNVSVVFISSELVANTSVIIIVVFTFYRINLLIWRESTIHLKSWMKGSYEENKNTPNLSKISQKRRKKKQDMTGETKASVKWSLSEQLSENFLMIQTDRPAVYLIYFVTRCTAWDSSDFPCATCQINCAQGKSTRNLNSFHILKQTNSFRCFTPPPAD